MAKVLIHIGLPKTATTTFQRHLFHGLHEEGYINFLGRYSTFDKDDYYNPLNDVLKSLFVDNEIDFMGKVTLYKKHIKNLIVCDKLNVLSEEKLTMFEAHSNEVVFERLKILFSGCHIEIVLFLRNQVDLMYSYYVEMYRSKYFGDRNNSSFGKYCDRILNDSCCDERRLYEYYRLIDVLIVNFGPDKVHVFLFEEFLCDLEKVLKEFSRILHVSYEKIRILMYDKKENVKSKIGDNYLSDDIDLNQYLIRYINFLKRYDCYVWLKNKIDGQRVFKFRSIYDFLRKKMFKYIVVKKGAIHNRMTDIEKNKIVLLFEKDNKELCGMIDVDVDLMKKYGYL
ncbi:sulfotransferase domain-containing protein [Prosthecochloris sp. SCSIO W1101]|uniref:sulfotransferase domain-containing protein n=1 Tax=Prosthecochloris sp. SCSIO W1101 TaxID=2992242 RepID=UPI00223D5BB5|nr:sulfotransferase domain-containing protein [Prosthecochloris sp. SCSIO W1101]UZJ41952.1 sulfotransferase domain-containing protein [Prosthecochloris sp. SCSIO W1101]